ncbi:MAG: hypothetical protein HC875_34125 [Anaerolineales bacterium]|nr:hypothetical protein [Anaerolineales bacterium]
MGYLWGRLPGVVVAASAIIIGVVSETLYTGWRVRPIHAHQLRQAAPVTPRLTVGAFAHFYFPLAITRFTDHAGAAPGQRGAQPHAPPAGVAGGLAGGVGTADPVAKYRHCLQ